MAHPPNFGVLLPKGWPKHVRSAIVHACSFAHTALTTTRGWTAHHWNADIRLKTEVERLQQELTLLQEEIRIKDARMGIIPAQERPHYPPVERLCILQLRAARGLSLTQTANRFLISTATVCTWMRRLDDEGPNALVQVPVPVNKFPDLVAYLVQRLKVLCPTLGYVKIAQMLCRVGLHLGKSTVRRMVRREAPTPVGPRPVRTSTTRVVGRYPHHVWHSDLTAVPTALGLWISWFPNSLPQRWPFCWWVAVVADHFSRRILGFAVFPRQPEARAIRRFLGRVMRKTNARPRHLVTDRGLQFRDRGIRTWCGRLGIHQLFGAIGQFGSIMVIERLIQTIKVECTRRIVVPYSRSGFENELSLFARWYNGERPHEHLKGATPDEVGEGAARACARPRFEPRRKWPVRAPCAAPRSRIDGRRGAKLELRVAYLEGRRHLPIIALERVA